MSKPMYYQILRSPSADTNTALGGLVVDVGRQVGEGWTPLGGPQFVPTGGGYWIQAMYRPPVAEAAEARKRADAEARKRADKRAAGKIERPLTDPHED